jgi:hypothetical protein
LTPHFSHSKWLSSHCCGIIPCQLKDDNCSYFDDTCISRQWESRTINELLCEFWYQVCYYLRYATGCYKKTSAEH